VQSINWNAFNEIEKKIDTEEKLYQFWCSSACHALYVQKNLIFHETCAFWINKPKKLNLCFYHFPFYYHFLHRSLSVTLNWGYEGDKEGPTRMAVASLHMTCQLQWALCTHILTNVKLGNILGRKGNGIVTRATLECILVNNEQCWHTFYVKFNSFVNLSYIS